MNTVTRILGGVMFGCSALLAAEPIVLNDDGAWNWLQDPRAMISGSQLIVASVALGHREPPRAGHVEVTSCDLRTGKISRFALHAESAAARRQRWADDHSCPALAVRPDGRLVAVYSTHAQEPNFYFRISRAAGDATAWGEEQKLSLAADSRVAFPTLVQLANENEGRGRLLLFFRGLHNRMMPSWTQSDDGGETWKEGGIFMQPAGKVTPYVKYATDGHGTVHFAFTTGHRVDFNNGLFHASYRDGRLSRSDGAPIGPLADGISSERPATEIFRANPDSVAMISDLAVDGEGHPCVAYSVQMNTRPSRPRPIGADHRYRYARWDGRAWQDREIAFAGTETHDAPDDDCTGLAAIDPQNADVLFISTNADPTTGESLISSVDHKRHWEIFRGTTADRDATWRWQAITRNSSADNLRPVVPAGARNGVSPVIWLRGTMRMPKDSALEIVLLSARDFPRPTSD